MPLCRALADLRRRAVLRAAPLRMGHLGPRRRAAQAASRTDARQFSRSAACLSGLRVLPAAAPGGGTACAIWTSGRRTDFIESATTADVPWTVGGLDRTNGSPCGSRFRGSKQRRLFDSYVELQRRLRLRRKIPDGLVPHMGSQWWCLTRQTLSAILEDPTGATYDRYFRKVWIPDESYFQTLARLYSQQDRKPVADAVQVRFPGQAAHLLRRPPAAAAPVGLLRCAQDLAPGRPAV